jgi:hypothetical protein
MRDGLSRRDWFRSLLGLAAAAAGPPAAAPPAGAAAPGRAYVVGQVVTYTYDGEGRLVDVQPPGRPPAWAWPAGGPEAGTTYTYTYDVGG